MTTLIEGGPAMRVTFVYDLSTLSDRALVHLTAALALAVRSRELDEYDEIVFCLAQEAGRRRAEGPHPGPATIEVEVKPSNAARLRLDALTIAASFRCVLDRARLEQLPVDLECVADCCSFCERLVGAIDLMLCEPEGVLS
jgi:hypothetical protein